MRKILILLGFLGLTSCATTSEIAVIPSAVSDNVSVIDHRTDEQKKRLQKSMFTPTIRLADTAFTPSLIDYFDYKFELKSSNLKYKIEVKELSVFDNYPARMGALMVSQGMYISGYSNLQSQDHIYVKFSGTVNGVQKEADAANSYHASAFALSIRNDKEFKKALNKSFDDLIVKLLK